MNGPHADIVERFRVFLSSPEDMVAERAYVCDCFEQLNRSIASAFGIEFQVMAWWNCVDAGGIDEPQARITKYSLEDCAPSLVLVIGLLGQRFGSPTAQFQSGTQEEFEWSVRHNRTHGYPDIKWFFRRIERFEAPDPENLDALREAVRQWEAVQRFRREYPGLYREYSDTSSFPEIVREDLMRWFARWVSARKLTDTGGQPSAVPANVPTFLDDRVSRTLRIVGALEDMTKASESSDQCIRICAVMSSFAIVDRSLVSNGQERAYFKLIEKERDCLEALFERGASLRMLLTWNVMEMVHWTSRVRQDVVRRLERLKSFCQRTLQHDDRIQRAQLIHIIVPERNLLILDERYAFEGRKLSIQPGFEATEVFTVAEQVRREKEMFDVLFKNALERQRERLHISSQQDLNRVLIEHLVDRIDRDIAQVRPSTA